MSWTLGFPGGATGKESTCQCRKHKRCRFDPWVGKIPQRRAWQPTAVFSPRESHGQRSLEGYSPQGRTRLKWLSTVAVININNACLLKNTNNGGYVKCWSPQNAWHSSRISMNSVSITAWSSHLALWAITDAFINWGTWTWWFFKVSEFLRRLMREAQEDPS